MSNGELSRDGQDSRPVPDPTRLTTAAVEREVLHVRELLEQHIDRDIKRLEDLTNERFESVIVRLELAEEQRREQKLDTGKAIDAALTAQREAANKSEAAISTQLQQMTTNFKAGMDNLGRELSDIKDRVTRMEAVKLGGTESRAGLYAAIGVAASLILAAIAVIALAQGV